MFFYKPRFGPYYLIFLAARTPNRALSTCTHASELGESSAVLADLVEIADFSPIWLRKLGPAECPRSAKKIVLIAHGFRFFNGFPHHGRPKTTVERGGNHGLRYVPAVRTSPPPPPVPLED